MRPVEFTEQTTIFGPPENWDESVDGKCMNLPVGIFPCEHRKGMVYAISMWLPSPKDIEEILKGKPIAVQIYGGQPPISLYTIDDEGTPNIDESWKDGD